MRVSAIVTTYERPEFLARCLASLEAQTRRPDEVIVADDGSGPEALAAARAQVEACGLPGRVVTQPKQGFRAAASRNNAVRAASGDWFFFADGDLLFLPDAIEQHLTLSEEGRLWTTGFALPLSSEETAALDTAGLRARGVSELWPAEDDPRHALLREQHQRFERKLALARVAPLEAHLRKLVMRSGNASVSRAAFEKVNGFDEAFVGWGCEDDDLALRLLLAGEWCRSALLAARALHMHHAREPLVDRGGRQVSPNHRYHKRRRWRRYVAERGLRRS